MYGVFPLRGKVLNVADDKSTSREIGLVEKALGLPQGPLRYGRVVVLADSDLDGKHILALILNWFATKYPHLLKQHPPFLGFLRTPIIKATRGQTKKNFYSEEEFRLWPDAQDRSWKIRYLKGLGSSSDQDIREDFAEDRFEYFTINGEQDIKTIEEAFRKTQVAVRKEWILNPLSETRSDSVICRFIQQELVEYSKETISRSIPSFFDGLKESQRKALWSSFQFASKGAVKVAQLAAHAAKITNYKHGEGCLSDVIIRLAQDFVGANNLSFFESHGQTGSRYYGGADAASERYVYVKLAKIVPYIFPQQDDFQLPAKMEDGEQVEPEFLLPIIPLALVNGVSGIATGFRTWIPPHDPLTVVQLVKKLIRRIEPVTSSELIPRWLGFTGKIIAHSDYVDTYGIIDESFTVKELPIGVWTNSFRELLDQLIAEKKLSNYVNHSKHNSVLFQLQNLCVSVDELHLKKRWSLKNLYLSEGKVPRQFRSCLHLLVEFVQWRRTFYANRRQRLIQELQEKQNKEKEKTRIIQTILEGKIPFRPNVPREEMEQKLAQHGIRRDQLKEITMDDLFEDKVMEAASRIDKLKKLLDSLSSKSPDDLYLEDLDLLEEKMRASNSFR
ncbi:DNA topoisomerase 2 [Galdieria sulphuraria]|nr:DNA topoisomerase 2 [Galdieria sulphuraria]